MNERNIDKATNAPALYNAIKQNRNLYKTML